MLPCLKCEGRLHTKRVAGVEVDQCDECSGLWLDNGELKAILAHDIEGLRNLRPHNDGHDVKRASCPRCRGSAKLLPIRSMEHDIHIDTCTACFGVWLDGGELEQLKRPAGVWQRLVGLLAGRRKPTG